MIRSDAEYRATKTQIEANGLVAQQQHDALLTKGLTEEQIDRALQPVLSFRARLTEELEWYEQVSRHEFTPLNDLKQVGRLLIGLRVANGMSQKELAALLGTTEAQVSRDERNEYHNVTVDRVQRIIEALNESITLAVSEAPYSGYSRRDKARELVSAS